jgi:hypothetical protein
MTRKMWNPYAGLNYPNAPYMAHRAREYSREDYNAARDLNATTRTVVAGAVTIGALGLLGSMFR